MKSLLFTLAILICSELNSQNIVTDSKAKPVYTYFGTKKAVVDISGEDFSITIRTATRSTIFFWEETPDDINVKKLSVWYIQPALLNAEKLITLNKLEEFKAGFKFTTGFQRVVEEINTDNYSGLVNAYGFNVFASMDHFNLYNIETNQIENKQPWSFGGLINATFFPGEVSHWFIIAPNVSVTHGWSDNGLISYKQSGNVASIGNVVAFDKFDGKYGKLRTDVTKFRFNLSFPVTFPENCHIFFQHINLIPYGSIVSSNEDRNAFFAGLYINILGRPIDFTEYKAPSSFGVGLEWNEMGGKTSHVIFIRGSVAIGAN